jgi:hypothetical protein
VLRLGLVRVRVRVRVRVTRRFICWGKIGLELRLEG